MGEIAPKPKLSLLGYSKREINSYIADLVSKTDNEILEKNNEIKVLSDNLNELTEENRTLRARVKELELEKSYISNAIIKAEQEASKIMENATFEAERKKKELLKDLEIDEKKLSDLQNEFQARKEEILRFIFESGEKVKELTNSLLEEFEEKLNEAEEIIRKFN